MQEGGILGPPPSLYKTVMTHLFCTQQTMSKRAYPQDPAVPIHSTIPPGGGGGNYARQYSYPGGPPSGMQPPGGSGYPHQLYGQAPPPSQGLGVPPSGYGPPGPAGQAVGRSLSGPPPPPTNLQHTGGGVVGGPQAPPTSVAPLTSGVTNMQLGPPNTGKNVHVHVLLNVQW